MNIVLNPEAEAIVRQWVADGLYASESEAISAAIVQSAVRDFGVDDETESAALQEAQDCLDKGEYVEVDGKGLKSLLADVVRRGEERLRKDSRYGR